MNQTEYKDIIDKWCDRYEVDINEDAIIRSYEKLIELDQYTQLKFDLFVKHLIRRLYYESKYPGLNLLDSVYSLPAQN